MTVFMLNCCKCDRFDVIPAGSDPPLGWRKRRYREAGVDVLFCPDHAPLDKDERGTSVHPLTLPMPFK